MYFIVKALFQKEKLKIKPEHADSVNISIINVSRVLLLYSLLL